MKDLNSATLIPDEVELDYRKTDNLLSRFKGCSMGILGAQMDSLLLLAVKDVVVSYPRCLSGRIQSVYSDGMTARFAHFLYTSQPTASIYEVTPNLPRVSGIRYSESP